MLTNPWQDRIKGMLGRNSRMKITVVVLALLGMALILWSPSSAPPPSNNPQDQSTTAPSSGDKAVLEKELSQILAQISGVGAVQTKVTLDSDGYRIYASNERRETRQTQEKDGSGTTREIVEKSEDRQLVLSNNAPVLEESKAPEVVGVLVVAEGADDPAVEECLSQAVTGLLGISASRVTVLPMNKGGVGNDY